MKPLPEIIDQNQLADYLNVSPRTLENWRTNGIGPKYIKLGKLARYRLEDVNQYLDNLSTNGEAR